MSPFLPKAKKRLHAGVRTGCQYLISLSVRLSVCVCVTFVVFTDCESCTRPISTNPVSMEAGEYGPTCGVRFFAVCLEVIAVTGLMWVSWCVFRGVGFFRVFREFACSNSFVDPASDQPVWTRRRGSDSQPIGPPRTRAYLPPPGVPFSVLAPQKYFEHGVSS